MLGLRRLRKKAEARILNNLSLPQQFYIPTGETGGHIVRIELQGHMWRIFPLYRFSKVRDIHWDTAIWQSFSSPIEQLKRLADTLCSRFVSLFKEGMGKQIEKTKESACARIQQAYGNLHEQFISSLIKKSRDHFRKTLFEKLGKNCRQIFVENTHSHLEMLAYKMREEFAKQPNHSSILLSNEHALPDNTRFLFKYKKTLVYVIEQKPQVHTVFFEREKNSGHADAHTLAFPYIVFFVAIRGDTFRGLKMFFRNMPLETAADELFCPALPNISEKTFNVCFPNPTTKGSARKIVDDTLNNYWGSIFNPDWSAFLNAAQASFGPISSLKRWGKETRQDTSFITSIDWHPAHATVEQMAQRFLGEIENETIKNGAEKTDLSSSARYTEKLSDEIAQKIQEACFFLVEHAAVDDPSKDMAELELKDIMEPLFTDLKEKIKHDIDAVFTPLSTSESIAIPINKAIAAMEMDVKNASLQVKNMVQRAFFQTDSLH